MMHQVDLSRFSNCTIKPLKIVDLMQIREFAERVEEFDGEIDDEWVIKTAKKVNKNLWMSSDYIDILRQKYGDRAVELRKNKRRYCNKLVRELLKEFPQYDYRKQ